MASRDTLRRLLIIRKLRLCLLIQHRVRLFMPESEADIVFHLEDLHKNKEEK